MAPFLDLGVGLSLGQFSTRVGSLVDANHVGLAYHWPVSFGLTLGARRQFELAFVYLFHPQQEQFAGGVALGYQFDLD